MVVRTSCGVGGVQEVRGPVKVKIINGDTQGLELEFYLTQLTEQGR